MAYLSSSSCGLHRLLDSIGQCSGSTFPVCKESFEHVINLHAPELLTVLRGSARPDSLAATLADATAWDKADSRLYSLLFFATTGWARITIQAHRKAGTSADSNGQLGWASPNARFDAHTQLGVRPTRSISPSRTLRVVIMLTSSPRDASSNSASRLWGKEYQTKSTWISCSRA